MNFVDGCMPHLVRGTAKPRKGNMLSAVSTGPSQSTLRLIHGSLPASAVGFRSVGQPTKRTRFSGAFTGVARAMVPLGSSFHTPSARGMQVPNAGDTDCTAPRPGKKSAAARPPASQITRGRGGHLRAGRSTAHRRDSRRPASSKDVPAACLGRPFAHQPEPFFPQAPSTKTETASTVA